MDIRELLSSNDPGAIIGALHQSSISLPDWGKLLTDYEPSLHRIATDRTGRRDRFHEDGSVETAARLTLGLEKLVVNRMTDFTFAIPVKRIYTNTDTEERKAIAFAIEQIFKNAHIDGENKKRGREYYAACQFATVWYVKQEENDLYGFHSQYKVKCKTFSPMSGVSIFPLFDEDDDLIALSLEYTKTVACDNISIFDTYTAEGHYRWQSNERTNEWFPVANDPIIIKKIPGVILYRRKPVWDGLTALREDIEYTLSRNSDTVAYNSAPILKVTGSIVGEENKGASRRIYRVEEGGDVEYVSWQQANEAVKMHVDTLMKLFFMQAQMPDLSFENMKELGNIGYDARKLMFADAHLKIGTEAGAWIEIFDRETKIIKAFLKQLNTKFNPSDIDAVSVKHVITPFIPEDESANVDKWTKACGNKAIISQKGAIRHAALTDDPDQTLKEIQEEEQRSAANRVSGYESLFTTNT